VIALLQRVASARVQVADVSVGAIEHGLLAFVCAEQGDTDALADRMVDKILKLRIFADAAGKMNRSVVDASGGLLVVSQFTLAADLSAGNRPSFAAAAGAESGRRLYDRFVETPRTRHAPVATGIFGAHMQVHLVNDGPVTIPLRLCA
jgi:D-tyrosyl-tRNA(Tyr) deacylase